MHLLTPIRARNAGLRAVGLARRARLPATLLVLAAVAAGCGSSSSSNSAVGGRSGNTAASASPSPAAGSAASSGNSSHNASLVAFAVCMRSHGVPNFPDPTGGGFKNPGSGFNPQSPAVQSAQSACHKLLPGGGPGSGPPSAQVEAQMRKVSQCMRAHGIPGFPDPTTTAPSNPSAYSAAHASSGVYLLVPKTINTSSPAFMQAARTCRFG
jgi:hypothetical protein